MSLENETCRLLRQNVLALVSYYLFAFSTKEFIDQDAAP